MICESAWNQHGPSLAMKPEQDIGEISTADVSSGSPDSEISEMSTMEAPEPIIDDRTVPEVAAASEADKRPVIPKIKIVIPPTVAPTPPKSVAQKRSSAEANLEAELEADVAKLFGADSDDDLESLDYSDYIPGNKKKKPANAFEEVVEKLTNSARSRRKIQEPSMRQLDAKASRIIEVLRCSSAKDREANRIREPAMNKMKALPWVLSELKRPGMMDCFVINRGASALKLWFDPLPDGSHPNATLTEALLKLVAELPVTKDDMIDSGLGRCIADVTRNMEQPMVLRKQAKALVDEWVRLSFGITYSEAANRLARHEDVVSQRTPQFVETIAVENAGVLAPLPASVAERRRPQMFRKAHRMFTVNVIGDVDDSNAPKETRPQLAAKLRAHEQSRKRMKC